MSCEKHCLPHLVLQRENLWAGLRGEGGGTQPR